jgi:hypothetical protein
MCIIKYNHLNENALHTKMEMIAKEIALLIQYKDMTETITVYTCPPLVYKKFDKYYYHIILQGQ